MIKKRATGALLLGGILVGATLSMNGQISAFDEDFELMNLPAAGDPSLSNAGWLVGANVFSSGGVFEYNYFAFPAPNEGAAFSAIATGEGGVDQGSQQLSVFSDYNNVDHAAGKLINALVFQEFNVSAGNVGEIWQFQFDAKMGNLEGASTAEAFVKTIDPNNGFAETNLITESMTAIPATWGTYSMSLPIDAGLVGQIFQVGFASTATNYEGSGVFYDNVSLSIVPEPSTYALVGGLVVLLVGVVRRRRRA